MRLRKKVCLRKREVVSRRILLLKVESYYSEICVARNWTLVQLRFGPNVTIEAMNAWGLDCGRVEVVLDYPEPGSCCAVNSAECS